MNNWAVVILLILIGYIPSSNIIAQNSNTEICDNALDDDQDGLIDLNDSDCICSVLRPTSLLPNSSFEQLDCCPEGHSMVDCSSFWIQASDTTPDLFHPCGYPADSLFDIPQPVPSGNGFIGIIDGVFTGSTRPNIKEYIGTCLDKPLLANTFYRLQFYLGFLDPNTSPPIDIVMFGATDCSALPFGKDDLDFGCPSNDPNWVSIGSISAEGDNEWRPLNTLITPNKDIYAIVIGPSCRLRSHSNNTYYLMDELLLTKRDEPIEEVSIQPINELCNSSFSLELPIKEDLTYQWYHNGIAIIGATEHSITYPLDQGIYHVRVIDKNGLCSVTEPYKLIVPQMYSQITATFCEGDEYIFGSTILQKEGIHFDTLQSSNLCDSIIELELIMISEITSNQSIKILEGTSYRIGTNSYNTPGIYKTVLPSSQKCDSTINLDLSFYDFYIPNIFSPNNDGNNDNFSIMTDADLIAINQIKIYDRWGNLVHVKSDDLTNDPKGWNGTQNGIPLNPGVYPYILKVTMIDEAQLTLSGMITLID